MMPWMRVGTPEGWISRPARIRPPISTEIGTTSSGFNLASQAMMMPVKPYPGEMAPCSRWTTPVISAMPANPGGTRVVSDHPDLVPPAAAIQDPPDHQRRRQPEDQAQVGGQPCELGDLVGQVGQSGQPGGERELAGHLGARPGPHREDEEVV